MARTTSDLVKGILRLGSEGGDYDDVNNPSLTPYIDTASSIIDDVVECAARKDKTLSATKLELIERWLSAHCYGMSDQTYAARSTAGASATFHGDTGLNLDGTKYGQMAKALDPTGCLIAVTSVTLRARLLWLGKTHTDQLTWDERN